MTTWNGALKITVFSMMILYFSTLSLSAADIIKNKSFEKIGFSGLPANFALSGEGKTSVQWNNGINALEFELKEGEIRILTQPSLRLKSGTRYQLSWWVAGDTTTQYMFYIEGNYIKNGKAQWDYFSADWRYPKPQWQRCQFEFTYKSENPELPYLAMQIKGPGKLSLKTLDMITLEEIKLPEIDLDKVITTSDGKNRVISGTENVIQINGTPFFPIFVWGAPGLPATEELFKQLESNGINCFFAPLTSNSKSVLDAAYKCNVKVILAVPKLFWIEKDAISLYHNVYEMLTPEVVNHPALFGYFLGDELLWANMDLKPILQVYHFLKKIDPNHPVLLNEAPRNSIPALAEYGRACDIYGVDIYPVPAGDHSDLPEKGLPSVGQYAKRMREAVNDKKPIFMALQGFSWSVLTKDAKPRPYPSFKQTRFMAYDSIINGATVLSWWGLFSVEDPKFYDDLFSVTKELYQITDVLTCPSAKEKSTCSDKAVEFTVKETPNGKVMIAANTSNRKIKVGFKSTISGNELYVFFENRNVKITNGVFADSFAPYEVHVYSTRETPMIKLPSYRSDVPCYFRQAARQAATPCSAEYSGKANWIWFPGKSSESGSGCEFTRNFMLQAIPKKAVLIATADDACKVNINGKVVAENSNWEKAVKVSVSKFLKKGANVITVSAQDVGGAPCGMLLDLQVEFDNGMPMSILSDTSWQCKDIVSGEVKAAEIITSYGGGPWQKAVKTP
jgi:hypothetical protein